MAGSIAAVCARVGQRNPGAISVVIAQPPTRSARSSTSDLAAGLGEKRGGDKAIVAGADDDDLRRSIHHEVTKETKSTISLTPFITKPR